MLAEKTNKKRFNIMLDQPTQEYLISAARERNMSASELVRELINGMKQKESQKALREVAESLYQVYSKDSELTEFTSMDGEDYL
jgi:vacuolar-type H+-ATPase subunit B/Vma2